MAVNPNSTDWTRPAQGGFSITPGASPLASVIRGINLATDGTVTVTHPDGSSVEYYLVAGVVHPIAATHVTAATATGIKGLY